MSEALHTLTAYHLNFSFMKRNNPLRDLLVDEIKGDEKPKIDILNIFKQLVCLTIEQKYEPLIGMNKIIMLDKITEEYEIDKNKKRLFLVPNAGKINIPIQMINLKERNKKYQFGSDWASTYPHNIFVYEINGEYYMICHRNGGSGCKTILSLVLNKILKQKGIKVDINWMPPTNDKHESNYEIDKISLIYEENKSSDVADAISKKKKRVVEVKKLTLSLNTGCFRNVEKILKQYKLKEISKHEAFEEIKRDIDADEYNNASLLVKIGKTRKKVSWDDFEGLIDGFDITDELSGLKGNEFIDALKRCSDDFLMKLINEE